MASRKEGRGSVLDMGIWDERWCLGSGNNNDKVQAATVLYYCCSQIPSTISRHCSVVPL